MAKLELEDELLYRGCKNLDTYLVSKLPEEKDIHHTFSDKFENNMRDIINSQKDTMVMRLNYKKYQKIAVVCLIITMGLITVTMNVEALRVKVIDIVTEIYTELTSFKFKKEKDNLDINLNFVEPKYIPSGFKEIDRVESPIGKFIVYENDEYRQIRYSCDKIENNSVIIDTENATIEDIKINGYDAKYIVKNNIIQIFWNDGNVIYLIDQELNDSNISDEDKEKLIKIAKNLK